MPGHTFPGDPHFLAIPRSYRNHPNGEFPLCGREWNKLPGWWLWGQVFHAGLTTNPPTHRESCCQGGSTHTHTGSPPVREGIHTEPRIPGTGSGGQGGTGHRLQESNMGKALPPQHLAGPSEAGGDAGSAGHHPELQE